MDRDIKTIVLKIKLPLTVEISIADFEDEDEFFELAEELSEDSLKRIDTFLSWSDRDDRRDEIDYQLYSDKPIDVKLKFLKDDKDSIV